MSSLRGVRVLDLSRLLPGPACTWYLHGLGASVDRVEPPGGGDLTRRVPPFVEGQGAIFAAYGRGKRSIVLDLRRAEAIDVLRRLLPRYDVLVEGFRPGVLEEMGLAPQTLLAAQPGLIIARISGFGQTGPWAQRPGHDLNYVGLSGVLPSSPAQGDAPAPLPVQFADMTGALTAAIGICGALFDRERSGRGRVLDVSLAESALAASAHHVAVGAATGGSPPPHGELLSGAAPTYGCYRCADGRFVTVAALEPKFHARLLAVTGAADRGGLAAAFAGHPRQHWVDRLGDACVGEALSAEEVGQHPQHVARGVVDRVGKGAAARPPFAEPGPLAPFGAPGADSDAVLGEGGFSAAEIAALRACGAVG